MKLRYSFLILLVFILFSINSNVRCNGNDKKAGDKTESKSMNVHVKASIDSIVLKYETEKRKAMIEILNKDSEREHVKLHRAMIINVCLAAIAFLFFVLWIIFMKKYYRLKKQ
jgi:hypothetical protein